MFSSSFCLDVELLFDLGMRACLHFIPFDSEIGIWFEPELSTFNRV